MTTETKSITIGGVSQGTATITRDAAVVFAYNPIWLEVSVSCAAAKALVDVTAARYGGEPKTYSVEAALYGGRCSIYLSRIFQLFFNSPFEERGKNITVKLKVQLDEEGERVAEVATYTHYAIWGSIRLGERHQGLGVFRFDRKKPYFERKRVWFARFPFKVTMLALAEAETLEAKTRYDSLRYDQCSQTLSLTSGMTDVSPAEHFPGAKTIAVIKQPGVSAASGASGALPYSTFAAAFDHTFHVPQEFAVITRLPICYDTCGHYLRWIDPFGCLEYYLFDKGTITDKYKAGSSTRDIDEPFGGMRFPDMRRDLSTSSEVCCKCCASLLPDDIYDYVRTIVRSPRVDLYMGKTKGGEEIWCPVRIDAGTLEYESHPSLHDIEISFQMPTYNSPSL